MSTFCCRNENEVSHSQCWICVPLIFLGHKSLALCFSSNSRSGSRFSLMYFRHLKAYIQSVHISVAVGVITVKLIWNVRYSISFHQKNSFASVFFSSFLFAPLCLYAVHTKTHKRTNGTSENTNMKWHYKVIKNDPLDMKSLHDKYFRNMILQQQQQQPPSNSKQMHSLYFKYVCTVKYAFNITLQK